MGFAKGTLILMTNGECKPIEKIKAGNKIMNLNGESKIVIGVENSKEKTYEIIPVKGNKYLVSKNHILLLKATNCDGITWLNKNNSYRIKWLEKFKEKTKSFSIIKYKSKQEAYKRAKNF